MKYSKLADVAFFCLCFTIYISINSITDAFFGIKNIASPFILFLSVSLLCLTGIKKRSFDTIEVKLFYALFISYYLIGLAVRLYHLEINYDVPLSQQINNFITSSIIIVCYHQYLYERLILNGKESVVFNSFYIPVIIAIIFAIYQSFLGIVDLSGGTNGRYTSFYPNPNTLGLVTNIGLILNIYSLLHHKRGFVLKFLLIPIILYVAFLSLSRTAIITCALIIILTALWMIFKLFKSKKKSIKRSIIVFGLPIYILGYISLNFDEIMNKYLDQWQAKKMIGIVDLIFKGKINKETTSSRSEHLELFYQSFLENPFLGKGLAYFADIPNYKWGVHNTFLLVLGDAGLFPFILLLILIFYLIFKSLFMKPNNGLIAIGLLFVWCLQAMTSHNALDDKMFLILFIFALMYSFYGNSLIRISNKI